jgi:alpha-amylase
MTHVQSDGCEVVLEAFHWNLVKTQGTGTLDLRSESWYAILLASLDRIVANGFTTLILPPPWRDDSTWESEGKHGGGEGYFWHDFSLDSRYGTREELITLIKSAHERGLKLLADIVLHCRDAANMREDVWPHPGPAWREGTALLALESSLVQKRMQAALDELVKQCGFDGWRWRAPRAYDPKDLAKWFGLTKNKKLISITDYRACLQGEVPDACGGKACARQSGCGETDEAAKITCWMEKVGGMAADIPAKRQIQSAQVTSLKRGLNMSDKRSVRENILTFVDDHTTGASPWSPANGWGQQSWPCPPEFKSKAYAFILMSPGLPCVYWPDCYDWGLEWNISELIRLRRSLGITPGSGWRDLTGRHDGFVYAITNRKGEDAAIVAIASDYPGPEAHKGGKWHIALSQPAEWIIWTQ